MDILKARMQPSLCPPDQDDRRARTTTVGLVQTRWHSDPLRHEEILREGIAAASCQGAEIVFLPELTLSRYPADTLPDVNASSNAEALVGGATHKFAAQAARDHDVFVHASMFQYSGAPDGRGLNTAIVVAPDGNIIAQTHKLHIPVTAGYFEDHYFAEGPAENPYPVHTISTDNCDLNVGLPTCWDEWFPEVARCYGLQGAELLCYPTAIGSEPDHPSFDTQPLWQQVIVGHAIANGLFIVVPNRYGSEGLLNFYGSSFIVDPFGRILAQAPRNEDAVLVAELDLNQRADWLTLFPFYATRRPDTYGALTQAIENPRSASGEGINGGIPGVASR